MDVVWRWPRMNSEKWRSHAHITFDTANTHEYDGIFYDYGIQHAPEWAVAFDLVPQFLVTLLRFGGGLRLVCFLV